MPSQGHVWDGIFFLCKAGLLSGDLAGSPEALEHWFEIICHCGFEWHLKDNMIVDIENGMT
ncbi:hypothetical protein TH5_00230 [Thalassospira xianhensis MCCC 1A02616]|uniref:Uncharacterized protein n=1 Tax=Thalassospira xianhensis MCCC 1A02616 TaxID=1177929 RepID=A0A367UGW6_9PROT|nr:hypothetical protein TH5_00230 [Thalassospira xianhensis MCCC 1A02616]